MSRVTVISVLGLTLLAAQGARAQSNNGAGGDGLLLKQAAISDCSGILLELDGDAAFFGPGDAKMFALAPADKGKVKASSRDLFSYGPDIWRVEIHEVGKKGKSVAGTGDQINFTGVVGKSVKLDRSYQLIVSPDSIAAGFPAGMEVCVTGPVTVSAQLPES